VTATYDPTDPKYFDPAALREEVDRVFDLCHGCRLCFNLCPSFPTMFKFVDANDGDVSALTDAEHDQVVDECYQCKLCYVKCPYVPPHEWELDFPRLMSRVHAVRQKQGVGVKERLTDQFLARTDAWAAPRSRRRRWSIGPPARRARGRAG
jgi:Fe-S oxidoreductase